MISVSDEIKLAKVAGREDAKTGEELQKFGMACGLWYPEKVYAVRPDGRGELKEPEQLEYIYKVWRPHKDIVQAFEVLEGLGLPYDVEKEMHKGCSWYEISIYSEDSSKRIGYNCPYVDGSNNLILSESICQAVLNAVTNEH